MKWDGSHLGSYTGIIKRKWKDGSNTYYELELPSLPFNFKDDQSLSLKSEVFCIGIMTKSLFPCIVEEIKSLFNIPRRGIHRITIDNKEYIIYYVPSCNGEIIQEKSLFHQEETDKLRRNNEFKKAMQRLLAFCEIMSLDDVTESTILIRQENNKYIPINSHEMETSIMKEDLYDGSIISETLFFSWFGEETSINDIVKEMTGFYTKPPVSLQQGCVLPNYIYKTCNLETNNLHIITSEIRSATEKIIRKYDLNYVWYSRFIIDRISRYLLPYIN